MMENIKFISNGLFASDGDWIHPKRIIDSFEIILVIRGVVHISEENTEYTLLPNNVLILYPGRTHYGLKKSTEKTSFYWLHFTGELSFSRQLFLLDNASSLSQMLKMLLHFNNTPEYPVKSRDLMCQIILNELNFISCHDFSPTNPIAVNIKEWICQNISKNISLNSIANTFGYNCEYIGRLFKQSYGIGVKTFICEKRLDLIKSLLINSSLSIKEIAYQTGFSHEGLLSKYFIYHEKISPNQFRKAFFNVHINNS